MSDDGAVAATATFELERFAWETPDQLELTGRFSGLADVPPDVPVLVVRGETETHRLPAVADTVTWPPADGEAWSAAFAWSEPPAPFAAAQLELGDGRHLELPEPGAKRPRFGRRVLEVRGAHADEPATPATEPSGPPATQANVVAEPAVAPPVHPPAEAVDLRAELVLAREEALAAITRAQDADAQLARVEADLNAERARRAGDVERFREAVADVQGTAAGALVAERGANAQLGDDLQAAHEELADARARLGELEGAGQQAREATEAARRLREERDELRDRLERAERAAGRHEAEARRLAERLAGIRQALAEDG
jgi:hypothetical protein